MDYCIECGNDIVNHTSHANNCFYRNEPYCDSCGSDIVFSTYCDNGVWIYECFECHHAGIKSRFVAYMKAPVDYSIPS